MSQSRRLSLLDQALARLNRGLNTLHGGAPAARRANPAAPQPADESLEDAARRHAAGLMRVNHAGEVCAQALYEGQAATARDSRVRDAMRTAAEEEADHLAWCEERLNELGARPTALNPLWYGLSFGIGAAAGLAGDRWSLGFVEETEKQVCKHLESHLQSLPEEDQRSRAIIEQMHQDEAEHAQHAREHGARALPLPVRKGMELVARVMTKTSYRI